MKKGKGMENRKERRNGNEIQGEMEREKMKKGK